jgi:formate dehydrogenase subunit delta
MSPERLVYMANQIGKFFASQGPEQAVAGTLDHLQKFWDPRMRREIVAYVDGGGQGLEPNVRDAVLSLKQASPTG